MQLLIPQDIKVLSLSFPKPSNYSKKKKKILNPRIQNQSQITDISITKPIKTIKKKAITPLELNSLNNKRIKKALEKGKCKTLIHKKKKHKIFVLKSIKT